MRVILFLIAFSNKVGIELCKKCNINLANPAITTNVFVNLRREALIIYMNEDSHIRRLRKQMTSKDVEESRDKLKEKIREREKAKEREARKKTEEKKSEVDDLTNIMKDLKIFQLEKKLEEQMAPNNGGDQL